ncbi:MAG: hypothetical protein A2751_05315 [Candidatus Doudnabacteria bacterium RIFCSPHIGHO2_01_FULL_46_14]|uniref:DNA polymerase beta n=1 Tax=Candidatus Doudnabacteria bacterium RIFCSPHIGHO2_01_FULL_46_14 TaxID=1817824 RepID=A0A1F5NPB9_9BACT|nr:MAG: hypothetical protein A2751_05315 [Candidatus Doudnabacteria bacterium RIFCSPHIGHO2_01_FULL_46_14]
MFQIRNADIAKILREMGGYYQMENEPWRPRAYEKAADSIESLDGQVEQIYREDGLKGLLALAGVGQRIAGHIEELLKTGRLKVYETLKKKMPVDLTQLTSIEGIGAKTVKELYIKLKIKNLKDLKKAVSAHKLSKIKGFGKRTEDNIRKSLDSKTRGPQRYLLGYIYPLAQRLKGKLQASGLFQSIEIGGSLRRRQETVGDLDYLGVADNPKAAMEFFVNLPGVGRVLEHGLSKSEIKMEHGGIQVDLRLVPRQSWGAALIYFTGDLGHNIKLRKMAIEKGWKLSEYGITSPGLAPSRGGKKGEVLFGKSEEEVYKKLGLKQVPPPEIRTDSGEIEAAQQGKLPTLIDYSEVRGDLQIQTDWTDGTASIEEMAKAAIKLGREYIAITDHTKTLHVAHGLDEKRLIQQGKEIDRLNVKFAKSPPPLSSPLKPTPKASTLLGDPGKGEEFPSLEGRGWGRVKFRILKGAEVNILKDGSLDIDDKTLSKLDIVGVSVHSHFKLSIEEQTARIIRALSNPNVDIFFHPTTRMVQKREPIEFDFEAVLKAAKKYRVALEINAHPQRLDLRDTMIRQAVAAGVKLTIDSDAHAPIELDYIQFGEAQARRGWATKKDILNTMPVGQLLQYLAKK